jgi:hypothetical protein
MNRKSILSIATGALLLTSVAAQAQYYYPPPPPPPYGGGYYRPPPPPPYGYSRQPRYNNYGSTCVTSRGVCQIRPTVVSTICKCYFDGFGVKRGTVR